MQNKEPILWTLRRISRQINKYPLTKVRGSMRINLRDAVELSKIAGPDQVEHFREQAAMFSTLLADLNAAPELVQAAGFIQLETCIGQSPATHTPAAPSDVP
mmetsp:Transcript_52786/g.132788  ORF Transcript_52786/g.132788 Transcript_52786/m.132788 type:complete len:102 (+) Transcript_52786:89-394(+)